MARFPAQANYYITHMMDYLCARCTRARHRMTNYMRLTHMHIYHPETIIREYVRGRELGVRTYELRTHVNRT